jgi:hypothetical protein
VVRIEQRNRVMNHELAEMVRRFDSEGIRVVLLKGQGNALMYHHPLRRQCGDIDLYVGRKDYQKACDTVRGWGLKTDDFGESVTHLAFGWKELPVELHRIVSFFNIPLYNHRYMKWSEDMLSNTPTGFIVEGEDVKVATPPPLFNMVYLFHHIFRHLIGEGVGLRQLCDWTLCLHLHSGSVDRHSLERILKRLGLFHTWQIFGYIVVERLGLSSEEMPFYTAKVKKKAEATFRIIEEEGNFGAYRDEKKIVKGFFRSKLHSYSLYNKRLYRIFRIFPVDTVTFYLYMLYNSLRTLMGDYRHEKGKTNS